MRVSPQVEAISVDSPDVVEIVDKLDKSKMIVSMYIID